MKYAVVFGVAGVLLGALGWESGGIARGLMWPAMNLFVLAVAYGRDEARLLGKSPDGRLQPVVVLLLAPYFATTWIAWHLFRRWTPEPCAHRVDTCLWVGRRPFLSDLPDDIALIVDLTAEFSVHPRVKSAIPVLCVPTLDARAPTFEAAAAAVARIRDTVGEVYIHCAAGHGRAATLASAVLLDRGVVTDVDAAEAHLQAQRPAVRLHRVQRALAARFGPELSQRPGV